VKVVMVRGAGERPSVLEGISELSLLCLEERYRGSFSKRNTNSIT